MGLAFNAAVTAAMHFTAKGREGATSTATGIAESLGIGVASGIGGAIFNAGQRAGWEQAEAIMPIWVLAILLGLVAVWLNQSRLKPREAEAGEL